jgi:DNA primase
VGRGLISDDIINQIRDRVDIADIVGHHVSLTRAGQNLKGLCPFHRGRFFIVSAAGPAAMCFHF